MKLSTLIQYKNHLDEITPNDIETKISSHLNPVIHSIKHSDLQMPHLVQQLSQDFNRVMESLNVFQASISIVKQEIDRAIEDMEPTYFSNSYRLYQEMYISDSVERILNRKLNLPQDTIDYFQSRIQMYSNWQNTGAILRPGNENWIEHMVGCDPLYLIDTDHDLFAPVRSKFNSQYLDRLRFYTIREFKKTEILNFLPDKQCSFFLAYNFFHCKPFDVLKQYLSEIYNKLDLGGVLAFTFNDCDRFGAVDLVERNFMCYTPGRLVRGLCENIGYEIINTIMADNTTTWMEIRKPGKHQSIKGGQTLAKIIEKSK